MLNRIRSVRLAKGLTLEQVAVRCTPPTTAQTIGRLETGTRTLSLDWLNRIADALAIDSAQLLTLPDQPELPVAATLDHRGAHALTKVQSIVPPVAEGDMVAMTVSVSTGDYRADDVLWLNRVMAADFHSAINRDVLIPRPAGRFVFGRLIGRDLGQLHVLPLGAGQKQQVFKDPDWIGVVRRLVREF